MENWCGKDIIAIAASLSITISENLNLDELISVIELLGLLKHDLEVIKTRCIIMSKRNSDCPKPPFPPPKKDC